MKLIMMIMVMVATGCATSHGGCNYAKAQKFNQKQMRKAERHRSYADNINNSDNTEYIEEIAFNEGISYEEVTQEMFNNRYR
jgi:hypothetical protein